MSTGDERARKGTRMLSPDEKREIDAELVQYADKHAGCIDALQIVQRHRGWVSDEAVRDIAEALGVSVDEVDGVATFYNRIYRRPVGRHVILICDSVSCWIMGYEALFRHLQQRLGVRPGETTVDRRFTVLPVQCLGACEGAPAIMVDGDLHTDVRPDDLDRILDGYP